MPSKSSDEKVPRTNGSKKSDNKTKFCRKFHQFTLKFHKHGSQIFVEFRNFLKGTLHSINWEFHWKFSGRINECSTFPTLHLKILQYPSFKAKDFIQILKISYFRPLDSICFFSTYFLYFSLSDFSKV